MWRNKSVQVVDDSDQSISDEAEEQDVGRFEGNGSLAGNLDNKKEGLGVVSQLELLKGIHQKDVGFSSEDEVEMPDFQENTNLERVHNVGNNAIDLKGDDSTSKVDEPIFDDEGSNVFFNSALARAHAPEAQNLYTRGKEKQAEPCIGSTFDKDARRQVRLGEIADRSLHYTSYIKDKFPVNGGKQKIKTKLASPFQPRRKGISKHSTHKVQGHDSATDDELLDEPETLDYQLMDKMNSGILGNSNRENMSSSSDALPLEAAIPHDHSKSSMAELFDDLCGNNRNLNLKSKLSCKRRGKIGQRAVIRTVPSPQRAVITEDDPCEIMDNGSSTDEEEEAQNLQLAVVESRRKTMADKFQEAFDCASVDRRQPFTVANQSSGSGLLGRLQQVMQRQKEQDAEFLKKLQAEVRPKDEARCIDVKILSRFFDAKLIVCRCSLLENEESSLENPQQEHFGKIWTIIFNSRVCGDVDLEVANFVRVHPPWKEVQVQQGGDIIILATYFSQIYN